MSSTIASRTSPIRICRRGFPLVSSANCRCRRPGPSSWTARNSSPKSCLFTEELSSQGIYGTSMVVNPPNFGWGFWMDIAASNGVNYFDENMGPTINTPQAVEALEMYKRIIAFGPPGKESMDLAQTIQRWQSGVDVMSIWWID